MAKPRVFISSTFYDLRQVREDLERFIRELGYDPIRHETGSIPYGKEEAPEEYAYREVELSDIIISIIGGRFGSESRQESGYSISQKELKRALELGIQVFIFIEKNVQFEFSTYGLNKEKKSIKYHSVDNTKVFEFIEQLHQLPRNNPITSFETSVDIITYLKSQWAGLFQRFLQDEKRLTEIKVLDEMKSVSKTLNDMVTFLTKERKNKDIAIQSILMANHPAFRRFKELTETKYRVYFTNKDELNSWLKARRWKEYFDELDEDSIMEWNNDDKSGFIKLSENIFDEKDILKIYTEDDWKDEWIVFVETQESSAIDDDLPF